MPRKKAETLLILRDGVFIADDERRNNGDKCAIPAEVSHETAKLIVENGHGRIL